MNESSDRDRMDFELERRPTEAENIGVEFTVSTSEIDQMLQIAPECCKSSKISYQSVVEWVLQL
jgi:hypothetical protein